MLLCWLCNVLGWGGGIRDVLYSAWTWMVKELLTFAFVRQLVGSKLLLKDKKNKVT